jgi:predicted metal-binding membrane protein
LSGIKAPDAANDYPLSMQRRQAETGSGTPPASDALCVEPMTDTTRRDLPHLPPAESRLGAMFARPKTLAVICVIALTALGWLALGLMYSGTSAFEAMCRPLGAPGWDASGFALVALMWGAMTLAMMLPSAAPMIFTYAEIADTAARKGEHIVSPFMLAGGFTIVWLGFAAGATVLQFALTRAALLDSGMQAASGLFAGAIFIGAGIYQFSALKHACLKQCQAPFPFFFANWSTTARGVFRLGVKQGLYCLGCCWAMMLVMFAVGVMNVVWMAALGVAMTVEKIGTGKRLTYAVGVALIAGGIAFIALAFAAHWPVHAI